MIKKYTYYLRSIITLLGAFSDPGLILRVFRGANVSFPFEVTLRGSGLCFSVRGAMDVWCLKETLVDRLYERYGTSLAENWKVIDIGAGMGDFTIWAVRDKPGTEVFAFEPFKESFDLLEKNLRINAISGVRCFNEAVSGNGGKLTLDHSRGDALQIQSQAASDVSASGLQVNSISLAQVLEKCELEACDLLKMDCEGAEYDILFHAADDVLCRIHRMVMEYHDGVTSYSHKDLAAFLTQKGYRVHSVVNVVHAEIGYLYAERDLRGLVGCRSTGFAIKTSEVWGPL